MGDSNDLHLPEQHKYAEAVAVLKLNTEQFPKSSNAFESYAEALQKNRQKEEAIKMYKEALSLNPKNEHAQQTLAELQKLGGAKVEAKIAGPFVANFGLKGENVLSLPSPCPLMGQWTDVSNFRQLRSRTLAD